MGDSFPTESGERTGRRRRFSVAYKSGILALAARLRAERRGAVLALLRQEGLRTSHLAEWRRQFEAGGGRENRGRPGRSHEDLCREIRHLRKKLASVEKLNRKTERMLVLQRKYVLAAALKLERKDRGLLSALLAQVEDELSLSEACRALGLSRRDYYRTIGPLRQGRGKRDAGPGAEGSG